MTVEVTARAVNSKSLFEAMQDMVKTGIDETGLDWGNESHRDSFVEMLNEFMMDFYQEGKIDQWKIMCDHRNNTVKDMNDGKYNLDLHYVQKHCLNTTQLRFHIAEDLNLTLDFG